MHGLIVGTCDAGYQPAKAAWMAAPQSADVELLCATETTTTDGFALMQFPKKSTTFSLTRGESNG